MAWERISLKNLDRQFYFHKNACNVENLKEFILDNNFISKSRMPSFTTFKNYIEKGRDSGRRPLMEEPPYFDHGYFYKNKAGEVFCIYQPYATMDVQKEIENWAIARGLNAKVYDCDYGWYSKTSILIVIGKDIDKLIIKKAF